MSRPSKQDLAGIRRQLAVDDVEAGGLAGAVRADHGEELARADREADVADRAHAAEGLGQRRDLEHAHGARACARARERRRRCRCGNASTSSRMMPPSSARQYSVCRITVSCRVVNTDGADDRPGQRLDAAEQHHHQAVDGAADADGLRRDRALGEGEQAAGDAADARRRWRSRANARA